MKTKQLHGALIGKGEQGLRYGAVCAGILAAFVDPALALLLVLMLPLVAATFAPLCLNV